jgi:hypothetical protein
MLAEGQPVNLIRDSMTIALKRDFYLGRTSSEASSRKDRGDLRAFEA